MESKMYFWAKTVRDAQGRQLDQPGISVRDHCLNVGCVADVLLELPVGQLNAPRPMVHVSSFALSFPLGRSPAAKSLWRTAKHILQRNCQTSLVFFQRLVEEVIQRAARAGVLFHLLIPDVVFALVEPLRKLPKFFALEVLDGGLDFPQRSHEHIVRFLLWMLNFEPKWH
jgi:hypothetical protein